MTLHSLTGTRPCSGHMRGPHPALTAAHGARHISMLNKGVLSSLKSPSFSVFGYKKKKKPAKHISYTCMAHRLEPRMTTVNKEARKRRRALQGRGGTLA